LFDHSAKLVLHRKEEVAIEESGNQPSGESLA
jgi:hypothetical protein